MPTALIRSAKVRDREHEQRIGAAVQAERPVTTDKDAVEVPVEVVHKIERCYASLQI